MTSMIERAIATLPSLQCADDRCSCSGADERWECIAGVSPRAVVMGVIEAMREPTDEMVRAGYPSVHGYEDMRSVSVCWTDMIDAALKETP